MRAFLRVVNWGGTAVESWMGVGLAIFFSVDAIFNNAKNYSFAGKISPALP
jgi:hypothetical protein